MYKKIKVENFRAFKKQETEWSFPLNALTIFSGTNSVGKSSILKVPLLLRQSIGFHTEGEGDLFYVGPNVDFGNYYSTVTTGQEDNGFILELELEENITKNAFKKVSPLIDLTDGVEELVCDIKVKFHFSASKNNASLDSDVGKMKRMDLSVSWFDGEKQRSLTFSIKEVRVTLGEEKSYYEISIPGEYFRVISGEKIIDVRHDSENDMYVGRIFLIGLLPTFFYEKIKRKTAKSPEKQPYPLPPLISKIIDKFRRKLETTHYIGPLRSPAKRYYLNADSKKVELDPSGDFLPYIISSKKNTRVQFWSNETNNLQTKTLEDAINYWIHFIRTGSFDSGSLNKKREIDISVTRGILLEMSVKSPVSSEIHALVDSGFGYSQIMPIIVRGLVSSPGETLIIEQPELHLNPALQVRIGQFLVNLIKSGRQIIIETHSEHIINAIRVEIAEDPEKKFSENCVINFLDIEGDQLRLSILNVKKDGSFNHWPKSFFGEALDLSARLLKAQRNFSKESKK